MTRLIIAALVGAVSAAAQAPAVAVHQFTADARSYYANAFWLESAEGLVLIDALFLRPDAERLVAMMRTTGKPLAGIILTHPHVDHFGGLTTVLAAFPDTRVHATRATADGVRRTHERAMADGWIQAYGTDYDQNPHTPDALVASGDTLRLAGMRFVVRDVGPGEAENNTVVHNLDRNVLFTGDATVAHGIYYVGEGRSRLALAALGLIARDYATVDQVFSGHYGASALAPLVAENIEQVRHVRAVAERVAADPANRTDGALTAEARRRLMAELVAYYARHHDYGLGVATIVQLNLAGLEPEILAGR